ncbi:MAG: hypothetical protein ACR2KW_05485 [Rubrobacter sp.]
MRSYAAPRLWMAALGGEVVYEVDLPGCCEHDARSYQKDFECGGCGVVWQPVFETLAEVCSFKTGAEEEERGAA